MTLGVPRSRVTATLLVVAVGVAGVVVVATVLVSGISVAGATKQNPQDFAQYIFV